MNRSHAIQHIIGLLVAILPVVNPAMAQEGTPAKPTAELPALPSPTEAQLKLGRELLDKIAYVVENVPLQDAVAVMKVFGFSNLYTWIYPTYVRLGPRDRTTDTENPSNLAGTGFSSLSVDPIVRSKGINRSAGVEGGLNPAKACITVDAVRERFGDAKTIRLTRRFQTDSGPRPPRVTSTDAISFEPLNTPQGMIGSIGFTFGYQICANQFGFIYKITEDSK